jgi:serine/threonine protein phosphatase PrpC
MGGRSAGDVASEAALDAFTDEISDSEIRAIVASNSDLQRVTGELVAEANAQGGENNISVVVARLE